MIGKSIGRVLGYFKGEFSRQKKKESVETTDGYCELGFCMYTLIWNIWNFEKRPKNLTQKRCRERVCERREGEKDVSEMKNVGKI